MVYIKVEEIGVWFILVILVYGKEEIGVRILGRVIKWDFVLIFNKSEVEVRLFDVLRFFIYIFFVID